MRVERKGVVVEVRDFEEPRRIAVGYGTEAEGIDAHTGTSMTVEDARWLQAVALPTALAEAARLTAEEEAQARAEVRSEPPANVPGELDENGQILRQLSIDG